MHRILSAVRELSAESAPTGARRCRREAKTVFCIARSGTGERVRLEVWRAPGEKGAVVMGRLMLGYGWCGPIAEAEATVR
jgi:hypothetical protein